MMTQMSSKHLTNEQNDITLFSLIHVSKATGLHWHNWDRHMPFPDNHLKGQTKGMRREVVF